MSKNDVSNEQLLEDIRLTKLELRAYEELRDGYLILAKLPENIEANKSHLYYSDYEHFSRYYNDCDKFLEDLERIADERGI